MNAIEQVVVPLKSEAVKRAQQFAQKLIDAALKDLAAHGWDVDKAAPRPRGNEDRAQYRLMIAHHNRLLTLTTYRDPVHRYGDPHIRVKCEESEARFIGQAGTMAAQQYDAFVAKLVAKIGAVESAKLEGSHVWGYSFLTVTKADGSVECWKTQTIINISKLGTVFNQWPTRKVKRGT